jgi:hypothetical protein
VLVQQFSHPLVEGVPIPGATTNSIRQYSSVFVGIRQHVETLQ